MREPRCLACRRASTKRGVRSPCPRYSAATVTPAIPHVGRRTPPNHDSNSRSTTRAANTSASKAPNQVNPGWSTEGGSVGGAVGTPNASKPSRRACTASSAVNWRTLQVTTTFLRKGPRGPPTAQWRDDLRMHGDLSSNSLQRGEAEDRAAQLTINHTMVELDLTNPSADTFTSRTTVTFESRGRESFLDFKGHVLTSASLNGVELSPNGWRAGRITLNDLRPDNTVVVEGQMSFSSVGEGLHRHMDPQDQRIYLYAMSFLDAAPRWFACFDQPDLKSSYELRVRVPTDWMVIGNGPAERVGRDWWRIVQKNPLSTYFVTLVAGPYASVLDEHEGIGLGIHARASLSDQLSSQAADVITVTKQSL